MRKYICFVFCVLMTACASTKSRTLGIDIQKNGKSKVAKYEYKALSAFNNDTLNYLVYNFIDNKGQYIGKPMSELFNKLDFQIKSYTPFDGMGGEVKVIQLSALSKDQETFRQVDRLKMEELTITLKHPVQWDDILKLRGNRYHIGEWTQQHEAFFGKIIVEDISYYAIK